MYKKQLMNSNNINYLLFEPVHYNKHVTVIIYHGWGSSIYNQTFFANILANFGYTVIIPEIIYHDSRQPLLNYFSKTIMEQYFWKTILQSVEEVPMFIHGLSLSDHKLIVFGSSMGGFIASGTFVQEHQIEALINVNGSGAWLTSEEMFQKQGSDAYSDIDAIKRLDPINFLHNFKNRPILLLHGLEDQIISPIGQQTFYEQALAYGEIENTNLSLTLYPHINHSISLPMLENVVNWIEEKFVISKNTHQS
ncbi:dienelactone hydrolase family protein [Bacillus sp. S10(2024)]|uniref:dienelactone hydrolase family protein n=1 Tax=Bacillus sp. S10(2024) TaxID=3162886 RepID=UPI003D20D162